MINMINKKEEKRRSRQASPEYIKSDSTTQERQKSEKALHNVKRADHFRLFFLFAALFLVLYLFYGNKFAAEAVWFLESRGTVYNILFFDVLFMLGASIVKMVLVSSYNRALREQKKN